MHITFRHFNIQALNPEDGERFFNLIDSNRNRLEDFFAGTLSQTKTLDDTMSYCREIGQKQQEKSYLPFAIKNLKTEAFIGFVDVKNIDWGIPKAELGYFIDKNYEGQGVISKSVELVIEYLLETYAFKKLLCRSSSRNMGSIAVAKKNGFILEGTIRRDYKTTSGELVDLDYYGRIF